METEFNNQFIGVLNRDMRRYQVHLLSDASVLPSLSVFGKYNAESKGSEPAVEFALQKAIQYPPHSADTEKNLKSGERVRTAAPLFSSPRGAPEHRLSLQTFPSCHRVPRDVCHRRRLKNTSRVFLADT